MLYAIMRYVANHNHTTRTTSHSNVYKAILHYVDIPKNVDSSGDK